jgi:hypothetical protein
MSDEQTQEQVIRERAYQLWEEEGRPDGHADEFWERARFLVGIEHNPEAGTLPNPAQPTVQNPNGTAPSVDVEPIEAVQNLGEFPGATDQAERPKYPRRAK